MEIKYEQCRRKVTLDRLLEEYAREGYKLKSVVMGDLMTRYELIFVKDPSDTKKYEYVHEPCRRTSTLTNLLNEYTKEGFTLSAHVKSDLGTRHELFFEREIKNWLI